LSASTGPGGGYNQGFVEERRSNAGNEPDKALAAQDEVIKAMKANTEEVKKLNETMKTKGIAVSKTNPYRDDVE